MSRFLFTTLVSDDLGLLTRTLPVARELAHRGHEVAYCNPANAPGKVIEAEGFKNLKIKHPLFYFGKLGKPDLRSFYELAKSGQMKKDFGSIPKFWWKYLQTIPTKFPPNTSALWDMDHFWAFCMSLNERFLRCTCDVFMDVMKEFDADVIVDSWNLWAGIAARALKKPLATIIQANMHPDSRFIWWREQPPDTPTPVPVVNKLLGEYGLKPVKKAAEFNIGDLTLVMGIPETDPLPDKPNVTYIGSILWEEKKAELPNWFDMLSKDKPIIWIYSGNPKYDPVGAMADSDVVLEACVEALAYEDVQVVMTTGHHALPKKFRNLPSNFRFEYFVPGLAMARRSDLLIHHGGYGSCQTGLFTGTPALIIPTFSERESNARRIASVGAGDFVLPIEYSTGDKSMLMFEVRAVLRRILNQTRMRLGLVDELRLKVRRILSDSSFTENAKRISEEMKSYGGASEAARLIEKLVP